MKNEEIIAAGAGQRKRRTIFTKAIVMIICGVLSVARPVLAQQGGSGDPLSLPPEYASLKDDKGKMLFLMNAISDSLNEGQLNVVLDWARLGLQLAEKNNIDTLKGIFLFDIGKAYTYKYAKYDSAIYYYKRVIPFFPDKMRKYNALSVREIMDRYSDLGNKDSSFAYLDRLVALIDTMPDKAPQKVTLAQNIANVYRGFGMNRTAIRYFQIAINGDRQNKNFRGLGLALANLAELYNDMEEGEKAIRYSKEALEYLADVNMPYMQTAANLAEYYLDIGQQDSAMHYLKISDDVATRISDFETKLSNQGIFARIYIAQKNYSRAKNILDSAITDLEETENSWNLCRTLLSYVLLDTTLHQYDNARKHLQQVLDISGQTNFPSFSLLAFQNMAGVYLKTGDYKEAYRYQGEYMKLKDSIAGQKARADLNDLEIGYKTLQKEQEIALLKRDNEIKNLQLRESGRMKIIYLALLAFLITLFVVVYYQRNQRAKIRTQKIRAELESKMLRSQMNPHFIFNSLNSIENFIMQNDKRQASDYLNKFSRLVRSILESSRNEIVPLEKDMEMLKLYIELEQLRFNNKFTYDSYIDPQLFRGDYRVPSLLIQPYVENAIIHGIAHSYDDDLRLSITASLEGEYIRYTIQDNGVGRELAASYNQKNKPGHHSIGLDITAERIALFNKRDHVNGDVSITDLYNENNKPDGTKVEIRLIAT